MTRESTIDELERRLAHQEHTIDDLSSVVADQGRMIDRLVTDMTRLAEHLADMRESGAAPASERPPHW